MTDRNVLNSCFALLLSLACLAPLAQAADAPEPGPENGGMRLRLIVAPRPADTKEGGAKDGFDVRLDLVNASDRPVTLRTAWEVEATGSVKDYLEAAASIESYPAFAPWRGGLPGRQVGDEPPMAEQVLKGGETLSIAWQSSGRELKRRVSDPFQAQNPTFTQPGLYSVHATLDVVTSTGTVRLRSNEQLVSIGGSRAMPKHTYGPLVSVNAARTSATLGLGSLHRVEVGDRFEITSKQAAWRLTVTEVSPRFSTVKLELIAGEAGSDSAHSLAGFASATLVQE